MAGSLADLGRAVKAKHPGSYDDMDDVSLAKAVQAKYPGSYDDFKDVPAPTPTKTESAVRGAIQGASLGFGDELAGAVRAYGFDVPGAEMIQAAEEKPVTYREARNQERAANEAARQANPGSYLAGELGGGLAALPVLPGGASGARLPLSSLISSGAKTGAALGAASGVGSSEAEGLAGNLSAGSLGAAAGGALGGSIPVIGAGLRAASGYLSPKLAALAERLATRSENADRSATRRVLGETTKVGKQKVISPEAIEENGRFLLDEGIPLRSPQAISEATAGILAEEGQRIGGMAAMAGKNGATFNLASATRYALSSPKVARLAKDTEGRPTFDRIKEFFFDQMSQGGRQISPEEGHALRMRLDDLAKWDANRPNDVNVAWRAARKAVNDELGDTMQRGGLGNEWAASNKRFSRAADAKELADIGAERRSANRWLSPSEKAAGIAGMATAAMHNPAAGVALPVATFLANRYAMPAGARTANALAGALERSDAAPQQAVPDLAPGMVQALSGALRRFRPAQFAAADDQEGTQR